jgi:hypothetical protein
MDRRTFLCLGLILTAPLAAEAQTIKDQVAAALRVEWQRTTESWKRPALEGHVYNNSLYRIGNVRLRVESLNGSSEVVGETFAWVYGNIRPGSRWSFSVPLPQVGETFRVTVESFQLVAFEPLREAP